MKQFALLIVIVLTAVCVSADEGDAKKRAERIQTLMLQLDSDEFQVRESAEKELLEIGTPAREALEKAAKSGSAEVKFRAARILKKVRGLSRRLRLMETESQNAVRGMTSVAVSKDGKFLYAAGYLGNSFAVFKRDGKTGGLTHVQTISDPQTMQGTVCLRLSPDGKYAAGTGFRSKTVLLFKRDAESGRLEVLDVAQSRLGDDATLFWPIELAFSPDSNFLYVADPKGSGAGRQNVTDGAIFCFRIEEAGGLKLVEAHKGENHCFTGSRTITVHPNGKTVYAPSSTRGTVAVLDRDPLSGKLTVKQIVKDGENGVEGIEGAHGVAISPDQKHLYVCSGRFSGDQAVSVFQIEEDGSLSLVEELVDGQGTLTNCQGANEIIVSPDGKHVYVAATTSGYVIDLQRDAKTGKLSDAESIKLPDEIRQLGPSGLGMSGDSKFLYAAVEGTSEIAVMRVTESNAITSKKKIP